VIARNALEKLLAGRTTWDRVSLSGDMSHWHSVYSVERGKISIPKNLVLVNPLMAVLTDEDVWVRYFKNVAAKVV
jgi:hypothetical protein